VTTRDLALTEIGAPLGSALHNAHFQYYREGDEMRFDHKLREGIVEKSNAVALMHLIGWEV
jgi:DNA mismatch repair ATPase MutS